MLKVLTINMKKPLEISLMNNILKINRAHFSLAAMMKLKMAKLSITLCVFIQLSAVQTEMVSKTWIMGSWVF